MTKKARGRAPSGLISALNTYHSPNPLLLLVSVQNMMNRHHRIFLSALAPVLIVLFAATRRLSAPRQRKRLAVVNFVDASDEYLWGVYSTHTQLKKLEMMPHVEHIAMVSQDISKKSLALLNEWLGADGIIEFDRDYIINRLTGDETLRQGVFLKLQTFNLTEFDKIILLDNDCFLRQNIMHWFEYPAPAATGSRGMMEWNSGAMVIEVSSNVIWMKCL